MCRVLTAVPGRGPGRRAEQYRIDDMTAMAAQPNGRRLQAEESDLHVSPLPSRRPRSTIRNAISFNSRESETEGTESRAPPLTGGNLHCLITSNSSIARLCLCVRLSNLAIIPRQGSTATSMSISRGPPATAGEELPAPPPSLLLKQTKGSGGRRVAVVPSWRRDRSVVARPWNSD